MQSEPTTQGVFNFRRASTDFALVVGTTSSWGAFSEDGRGVTRIAREQSSLDVVQIWVHRTWDGAEPRNGRRSFSPWYLFGTPATRGADERRSGGGVMRPRRPMSQIELRRYFVSCAFG